MLSSTVLICVCEVGYEMVYHQDRFSNSTQVAQVNFQKNSTNENVHIDRNAHSQNLFLCKQFFLRQLPTVVCIQLAEANFSSNPRAVCHAGYFLILVVRDDLNKTCIKLMRVHLVHLIM